MKNDLEWDFSALFENDEKLDIALVNLEKQAKKFKDIYIRNLKSLNNIEFQESLNEYENILEKLGKIMTYAYLKFAQDTTKGGFFAKFELSCSKIHEEILFYELEFNQLPRNLQKIFIDSVPKYEYFLKSLQKQKPYQLSQKEERIMLKKSITSNSAFSRLFDEHFSTLSFRMDGKVYSEEEILSFLHDSDRNIRKKAASVFTRGLKPHLHLLGYIFNMIKKDLSIECELRGYKNAEFPRHESNKTSQKSVDSLIRATESRFDIVRRFYNSKREVLGLEVLYDYDRYAPLEAKEDVYSYEKSKKIVQDAFGKFSSKFLDIANLAFENGWIDVYPKDDKRSGAFSHPASTDSHPYVLLNHTNRRRDVFTLAHELGHAIHQYLARDVGYINSDTPLTTAETASVFAEMLVFDYVKENVSKEQKLALLGGKIEDIFATLYRQINFTTFERRVHSYEGELSIDEFNKIWIQESKKMFGNSVRLGKNYHIWWSYIPHFIHSPFYCYAYSYAQLLVLALYGLYKEQKDDKFVEKFVRFLSLGGSKSPKELVGIFGFNIEDEAFWQIGLNEIDKLVREFEELR